MPVCHIKCTCECHVSFLALVACVCVCVCVRVCVCVACALQVQPGGLSEAAAGGRRHGAGAAAQCVLPSRPPGGDGVHVVRGVGERKGTVRV
eukprot:XP_001699141.1 predicted protein [Chlamydomonas reinhardtii]